MKKHLIMSAAAAALLFTGSVAFAQSTPSGQAAKPTQAVAGEDATLTAKAKVVYASIVAGKVDRSQLSAQLNQALSDDLLRTLSQQLTALGTPSWSYVDSKQLDEGKVAIYALDYAKVKLKFSIGIKADGTIWDLTFTR